VIEIWRNGYRIVRPGAIAERAIADLLAGGREFR
jgi:hypothetical protein